MESVFDMFIRWAAEELVAAGRAETPEQRQAHRRQGELLVDIVHALQDLPQPRAWPGGPEAEVGEAAAPLAAPRRTAGGRPRIRVGKAGA